MTTVQLKSWDIVRVMIGNSGIWVTDVVYRVRENPEQIDVGMEPVQQSAMIKIGEHISVKYVQENFEILVKGHVHSVLMLFPQCIRISVESTESHECIRDSVRFDVNLSTIVKRLPDEENGAFGNITNISASGMSLVTHIEIERLLDLNHNDSQGPLIYAEAFIRPDKIMSLQGYIIRFQSGEKGYEYGIRFIKEDNKRLMLYIYSLEDDQKNMLSSCKEKLISQEEIK
jgi:hypothetical protein